MVNIDKKKKVIIITSAVLIAVITILSVSMAYFREAIFGNRKYVITASSVLLRLDETSNSISLGNTLPQSDEDGMNNDAYTFSLTNLLSDTTYQYTIYLVDDTLPDGYERVSDQYIKYYLTNDSLDTQMQPALLSTLTTDENGRVLETGIIDGKTTYNYTLRFWVDYDATQEDVAGKAFSTKLNIIVQEAKEYADASGANMPELTSGMIAVIYDETDKTWVKADTTKEWYNYDEQMWANAVTVTEDTRDNYMAMAAGEPISMDDINTMWVWIPRYSYTIFPPYGATDTKCSELDEITIDSPESCRTVEYPREEAMAYCQSNYGDYYDIKTEEDCIYAFNDSEFYDYTTFEEVIDEFINWSAIEDTRQVTETYPDNYQTGTKALPERIDIKFITTDEKDSGTGQYENTIDNWVTPEGFTFGTENIPGFWMAKFETSTLETCTAANGSVNTACDLTTLTPQVKPNVTSWRGARVSTFFETSRLMQSSDDTLTYNADTYGFDAEGASSMDVHMLKNSEWGIVAMLSQSKYGKYGNLNYEGVNREVYQNKSSSYKTGMSNGTPSTSTTNTQSSYDTPDTGYGASTTGTIYGVYDMSGGADEYVMGNYNNYSGQTTTYNSGFCGTNGPSSDCREWPDAQYFDLYTTDTASTGYKFGDATYENGGWYSDYAYFVNSGFPWFHRGGYYFSYMDAGAFNSSNLHTGSSSKNGASRFAIKP